MSFQRSFITAKGNPILISTHLSFLFSPTPSATALSGTLIKKSVFTDRGCNVVVVCSEDPQSLSLASSTQKKGKQ